MCMRETSVLVVAAPMMAAPLDSEQHDAQTVRLSAVEAPAPMPGCQCLEATRFSRIGLLSDHARVTGTLAAPSFSQTAVDAATQAGGGIYIRTAPAREALDETKPLVPAKQAVTVRKSEPEWSEGEHRAAIVSEIQYILRMRRARTDFFDDTLFADPAWDMVLDLMEARLRGAKVSISSLCMAASVPPTTALRWIRTLTQKGIIVRTPDRADKRRIYVVLSDAAAASMMGWFERFQQHKPTTGL